MTEHWRAGAKKVALEVYEALLFDDEEGAVEAILELIERVKQETWTDMNTKEFLPLVRNHSVALEIVREVAAQSCPVECGQCIICRAKAWLYTERPPGAGFWAAAGDGAAGVEVAR